MRKVCRVPSSPHFVRAESRSVHAGGAGGDAAGAVLRQRANVVLRIVGPILVGAFTKFEQVSNHPS